MTLRSAPAFTTTPLLCVVPADDIFTALALLIAGSLALMAWTRCREPAGKSQNALRKVPKSSERHYASPSAGITLAFMRSVKFGPFVFDPARGGLSRDGRAVAIGHRGVQLLAALLETPGEVVGKAALMNAAWPGMAVEESNLSVQIAALRKLLGGTHDGGEWIVTAPRVGYRFSGAVAAADNYGDAVPARPLIAVLPFGIASDESGKDYLADGMMDDIITALTRFRWFRVVVRGSASASRDTPTAAGADANLFGARYALHGSVRYANQRLRISARLIDTQDGVHLWAERYDLAPSDVFTIQDEIAERVVGAIEPELLKSESRLAVARPTGNLTAWDLVRQGMWHFHKVTRQGHLIARELFRRACAIDPDLPEAHSWLGRVSTGVIAYGWSDDAISDGREGTDAATRAVALDPRDPYSHYAFAIISCYAGSPATAIRAAQSAIDLNPSFALGHLVLGMARLFNGEAGRAAASLEHGLMLNPNDPQNVAWNIMLAYAQLLSGQPNEGVDSANRALAIRPLSRPALETLACCTAALGRIDEAKRWASRMREADGPASQLMAPLRINQPGCYDRIVHWLQEAGAGAT